MNLKRYFVLILIFPLLFDTLSAQNTKQDKIRRYLIIKGEIEQANIDNLIDLDNALIRIQRTMDDKENKNNYTFSFYFNRRGIDFYKYLAAGRSLHNNYVSVAGIDKSDTIFIITNPIKTINDLVGKSPILDTSSFADYVLIYDKLEYCNRHIEFLDKYDPKIFGSILSYKEYNRVELKDDGAFQLFKLFREDNDESIDIYLSKYSYEHGMFSTKTTLRYRIPK
jgi:hypothetical protein